MNSGRQFPGTAGDQESIGTGIAGVRPLALGSLRLRTNLFLSPLAGYTTLPFRLTIRELGGLDLCTTDLVSVRSLLRRNPIALQMVASCAEDTPLAVQLFGADPIEMRDGAQLLEEMGIASVDINMGCPVDRVTRTGSGSLLMTCHRDAARIVEAMVGAVRLPVTAKMRLGWDAASLSAPDLARTLEDAGAAAVFVHGRTREQGFAGSVDLAGIRAVVAAVRSIPVIGNGDVTTPTAARRMVETTGCAGVSIGRGAFYNPWIFAHTERFLATGELPEVPGIEERLVVMRRHLDRMVRHYGETKGCVLFRKIAPWYVHRSGPTVWFRRQIFELGTRSQFEEIVAGFRDWRRQFLDANGELLPRFRPANGAESQMADRNRDRIAVPRGPVSSW